MRQEKVSIIIRTRNEEKWISHCLHSVFGQSYKNIEVIVVDNRSTDATLLKAKEFPVKIVQIKEFLPGKAINAGIRASTGSIIVILSGHCIPVNNQWLVELIKNLKSKKVAGVYGRQQPLAFTPDTDKRDLTLVFGLDKKVQRKDPFFHNANSAFRRSMWQKVPFDETVTNIEDRVWGQEVIKRGYTIVYEPNASVYHYHGIHQDGNPERCRNVVRIIESLNPKIDLKKVNRKSLNIIAIIPVKGEMRYCGGKPLISYTLAQAKKSTLIKEVFVATDNPTIAQFARTMGAKTPFIRPEELSRGYVSLSEVLRYSLGQIEDKGYKVDLVIVLEETYPFRTQGLIDQIIMQFLNNDCDSVIPAKQEARSLLLRDGESVQVLDHQFAPRDFKQTQMYINLTGLGLCTYPRFIREGTVVGPRSHMLEITDIYSGIEVRSAESLAMANRFLAQWWKDNGCADL